MKVAVFGGGRVGTAMAAEMPGVPVVRRGQDLACEVACICWPAQAVVNFAAEHPLGAKAIKVSFCNGVWATRDGADHQGICYVRAVHLGDVAKLGRKAWRVKRTDVADALVKAGLRVTKSKTDHDGHLWSKALYLLPMALACADVDEYKGSGRLVTTTQVYAEWYDVVRQAAVKAIGEAAISHHEPRVKHLVSRTPRGWVPSPSPEELQYFRDKLCAE